MTVLALATLVGGARPYEARSLESANALDFDGSDDRVTVGDAIFDGLSAFTIEVWVYPHSLAVNGSPTGHNDIEDFIIHKAGAGDDNLGLTISTGGTVFYLDNGGDRSVYGPPPSIGDWTHLAAVYDGAVMLLYLDGVQVAQRSTSGPLIDNNNALRIGGYHTSVNDSWFDGVLDELRIWDHARTQAQILAYMDCPLEDPVSGLIAYYTMDQGIAGGDNSTETVLIDQTGHGYDGVLGQFSLTGPESNWVLSDSPPAACAVVGVDLTSWGRTKDLYR